MIEIRNNVGLSFWIDFKVGPVPLAKLDFLAYYSKIFLNVSASHSAKNKQEYMANYLESGLIEPR